MMNHTLEEIYSRKSIRAFMEQPIDDEAQHMIITAATMAPTAGNQQLYTILKITDPLLKQRLSETCDHQSFIAKAPMILVFCADCQKWYDAYRDTDCKPRDPGVGDLMLAVTDSAIAAQNAVTAAESLGIGSCYIGDIMENCEIHREILRLPDYVFPAVMLIFGYPTKQQKERTKPKRAPIERIVYENEYPDMNRKMREELFGYKKGQKKYDEWMQAFCARKYNSDFSVEMTRSVKKYIEKFMR